MRNIKEAPHIAAQQEQYYASNEVFFGCQPKSHGDASWALALNHHSISPRQYNYLTADLPHIISDFHTLSAGLLRRALLTHTSPQLVQFGRQLTAGLPDETIELYYRALQQNKTLPFSSRPDTLRPKNQTSSAFPVIEYNVDGTADKGFTEAVNIATSATLDEPTIGEGLASLFVKGARSYFPDGSPINAVTILPEGIREDYISQNTYFAKQANALGETDNVTWRTAFTSEVDIRANGLFVDGKRIDVVDKEFKLPGYTTKTPLTKESEILSAILDGGSHLLGTPLPLGDKLFLAAPFNPAFREYILEDLGEQASERLAAIQKAHVPTRVLDHNSLVDELQHPDLAPGFVLKKGGDTELSSESRGVFFSHGRGSHRWEEAMAQAIQMTEDGQGHWIIQPLLESQTFDIGTIKNNRAKAQFMQAPVRFAPYYAQYGGRLTLGSVLVTAGTDREVVKLGDPNIHGQDKNTYQGVAVK